MSPHNYFDGSMATGGDPSRKTRQIIRIDYGVPSGVQEVHTFGQTTLSGNISLVSWTLQSKMNRTEHAVDDSRRLHGMQPPTLGISPSESSPTIVSDAVVEYRALLTWSWMLQPPTRTTRVRRRVVAKTDIQLTLSPFAAVAIT
jgi:hypothetical protein